MPRNPEVSSSFYGPYFNGCFILNVSPLAMITIYARIQADHFNEVLPSIDANKGEMIETKPRSKIRAWLGFVAFTLLGHLVAFAIAWGIHYAFF